MGMECGGTMTILLEYYHATSENMNLLRSLIHVTNQASSHRLVRSGTFVDTTRVAIDHHIIPWKARSQGSSPFQIREQLQHHGIHLPAYALEDITTSNSTVFFLKYGPQPSSEEQMQHFISIERPISLEKLYIFGAGHIARSLAQMAVDLDFQVHVFDDREEFAHPRHFPDSTVVHVITDFEEVMNSLSVSSNDYIVIVTRGHQYDKTVLAQALATPAKYLGMIGSTRKKQVIYQQLIEDGWNWHELKRVYCPIGLSIGAQTPTEISLSILGQMIQTRRGQSRDQTIPATHFKP
jgi:xanthine dehydrogenase accessory factor